MISDVELAELEARVVDALERDDRRALDIIGFGVTSAVFAAPTDAPRVACKRLPPFPDRTTFEHHREAVLGNVDELRAGGVDVVDTDVRLVEHDGACVGYVVQPLFEAATLGPAVLAAAPPGPHPLVDAVVDAVAGVTTDRLGLDAQISNWVWVDDAALYLDVTTPFWFDGDGDLVMDIDVMLRHGPAVLRPVYRRQIPQSMRRWTDPRMALLDLVGNLYKEDLDGWVEPVIEAANRVADPAIGIDEARTYYGGEVRTWGTVHRVLTIDEWWQRRVRRRVPAMFVPPADYDARAWKEKQRGWR